MYQDLWSNQWSMYVFKPFAVCFQGKPVNLSSNCFKHVLAELKHFHTKGLQQHAKTSSGHADSMLPQIPPPPWTPAVLSMQQAPQTPGGLLELEDGGTTEEEGEGFEPGGLFGALSEIDKAVDQVSCNIQRPKQKTDVTEYVEAIDAFYQEKQHESKSLDRPCKKPRGNFGFFKHLRDQRAIVQRGDRESSDVYEARLRESAKTSWRANVAELICPITTWYHGILQCTM